MIGYLGGFLAALQIAEMSLSPRSVESTLPKQNIKVVRKKASKYSL